MNANVTMDRVSCNIRVIAVEPYRTVTKFGDSVEVHEFQQDADGNALVTAVGFRIKRNGEPYARSQDLLGVEIPAHIAEMLR